MLRSTAQPQLVAPVRGTALAEPQPKRREREGGLLDAVLELRRWEGLVPPPASFG